MPQGFNEAMAKIMPIILQVEMEKQRQKMYLANQLKEYAAYGETQKRLREQELSNTLVGEGARVGGDWAKKQPFSMTAFVEGLRGILSPELMTSLPFKPAEATTPALGLSEAATAALVRVLSAQARRIPPDPADLQIVATGFGSDIPGNVISDITQRQSEEENRKLGYKQLERQTAETGIRAGNLDLRRTVEGKKVDEMKAADIKTLIGTYQAQQKQIQARLSDLYTPDAEKPALNQQLQDVTGRLDLATNVLEQKILAQSDKAPKEYTELVDELKGRGITREQVVNNGDLRRQLLIQGYSVTKVLNLWK